MDGTGHSILVMIVFLFPFFFFYSFVFFFFLLLLSLERGMVMLSRDLLLSVLPPLPLLYSYHT